jgi:hypothetical protein
MSNVLSTLTKWRVAAEQDEQDHGHTPHVNNRAVLLQATPHSQHLRQQSVNTAPLLPHLYMQGTICKAHNLVLLEVALTYSKKMTVHVFRSLTKWRVAAEQDEQDHAHTPHVNSM